MDKKNYRNFLLIIVITILITILKLYFLTHTLVCIIFFFGDSFIEDICGHHIFE